ncbi:MAG: DNA polymerase III subunit delta' [Candidatus Nanopelagicales bacterium]
MWQELIGQDLAIRSLQQAAKDSLLNANGKTTAGFSQSWLITGPPGSGRSTAAKFFAAALQCEKSGCGECATCKSVLNGSHPDVKTILPSGLTYGVDEVKDLMQGSALIPAIGQWNIFILEDADRLTTVAANALLKSIEEPARNTMWILLAPSSQDVISTIRSRCRMVNLRMPPFDEIAELLKTRDGVDPAMAKFSAAAALGHVGRAKLLALDENLREIRRKILQLPFELSDLPSCFKAAAELFEITSNEAERETENLDKIEQEQLLESYGSGAVGLSKTKIQRMSSSAMKELAKDQKARNKRISRDRLDLALVEIAAFYRDVLAAQAGAGLELFHEEHRGSIEKMAASSALDSTIKRLEAVEEARNLLPSEASPLLVLEAMMIQLARA